MLIRLSLKGGARAKDRLHQVADNLSNHVDDVLKKIKGVDMYEPKHKSPVQRDWRGKWKIDGMLSKV